MSVPYGRENVAPPLLGPEEPAAFEILNPEGTAPCLIICEHASNRIPEKLGDLGLSEAQRREHIAWDVGVAHITRLLAERLNAPAILANYSRLVVDLNRRTDHPTAFVTMNEGHAVPGNLDLSDEERAVRIDALYDPFHDALDGMVQRYLQAGTVPAVISIHSYTPVFYEQKRPWEIGVLWVQDPRLPLPVIDYFKKKGFTVGDNEPYDAKILRGTTVNRHADDNRLPNALIEIRNDLIDSDEKGAHWADMLGDCLETALQDETLYSLYDGPEVPHDPDMEMRYFDKLAEKAKQGKI